MCTPVNSDMGFQYPPTSPRDMISSGFLRRRMESNQPRGGSPVPDRMGIFPAAMAANKRNKAAVNRSKVRRSRNRGQRGY